MSLKDFSKSAIQLSKNPIGIIGLFLVLVYGIAAVVITSSNLEPLDTHLLVGFLVLFPLCVLIVFFKLVTGHHSKLYAPSDFENDDSFMKSMEIGKDDKEKKVKLKVSTNKKELTDIDWNKYKIKINKYLPQYDKIVDKLNTQGLTEFDSFGKEIPPRFTLTFSQETPSDVVKRMIEILSDFDLDSIRCTKFSKDKKVNFYIGSAAYKFNNPMALLDKKLKTALLNKNNKIEDLRKIVKENYVKYDEIKYVAQQQI